MQNNNVQINQSENKGQADQNFEQTLNNFSNVVNQVVTNRQFQTRDNINQIMQFYSVLNLYQQLHLSSNPQLQNQYQNLESLVAKIPQK
jgi:hypothetical protein